MNSLEKEITPLFLLKFTLPNIIMMVFNSFYTMVDGGFVSNFVGTGALSAVNIVYPLLSLVIAVGIMLATGGSAVVARQMGEGSSATARKSFSLIAAFGATIGLVVSIAGICFTDAIVRLLGANEAIYRYCYDYAFYLSIFAPFSILQVLFQFFFVTAGKPHLGLITTLAGGIANIVLDYLFIVPMKMGIRGAAIATGIGFVIPAVYVVYYFCRHREGSLYFVPPTFCRKTLTDTCVNGSSEMVSNLAVAVTTLLFNLLMMRYLGENGVAAITIVFYAQFLFAAIFLGYTSGVAPLFSFNYGAQNIRRLKKLFSMSMFFILVCSALAYVASILLAESVVGLFSRSSSSVFELAIHGMDLFAIGFFFMGFNIFASGLFTSLSNGKVSAIVSFLRTLVFIVLAILILPAFLGIDGVWLSIPLAELLAALVCLWYVVTLKKVYQY